MIKTRKLDVPPMLLTQSQDELLKSAYLCCKLATEFLTMCFEDAQKNNPRLEEALTTTVGNQAIITTVLDKNLDCNKRFRATSRADALRLFEIIRQYQRMTEKDQATLEDVFTGANKGRKIKIIQDVEY